MIFNPGNEDLIEVPDLPLAAEIQYGKRHPVIADILYYINYIIRCTLKISYFTFGQTRDTIRLHL